ncbi:MAG: formate dehydrogenase accessory sulfurtransferase FdhD [Candidatus Adiutrix sp.]|jgi:FdhD protein|nr:formate dehydrogenase accessory sulfurtransferase FdhD [Candidatus Adiutrix sp.]
MPPPPEFEILRHRNGVFSWEKDLLVEERLVDIYIGGRLYASVMATPTNLDHLAVGYLYSEGVIKSAAEVTNIRVDGLRVHLETLGPAPEPPLRARSSGFGLGAVSLDALALTGTDLKVKPAPLPAGWIVELMEEFNKLSVLFRQTGAVHSAWLLKGDRRYFADDVGRHNALDKVVGQYLRDGAPPGEPGLMLTTGRVSTEMVLKTGRAGLGALVSRGAASNRALALARQMNLILVVLARGTRLNVINGVDLVAA